MPGSGIYEKTADLLFQYLKDILYNPNHANLRLKDLPPEFVRLGEGMKFLDDCVQESRLFSKAIAKGDLSSEAPGPENGLAAPMKDLQNSLRHLTWQTQEVAKGDYSQNVDFMGEFSDAFNTMTRQLRERQQRLIKGKKIVELKNLELEKNLELVMALTNFTHNMIFVYSVEKRDLLFWNESAQWFDRTRPDIARKVQDVICSKKIEELKDSPMWEMEFKSEISGAGVEYFGVESYCFLWRDCLAMIHILMDETERKQKENMIYKLAFVDPLTGLNNRRYAMDRMRQLLKEDTSFVMSFIDVDYLKYCNDTFGHKSGDEYLAKVASALKSLCSDVCRIGGDEFIMIQTGITAKEQDARLDLLRKMLWEKHDKNAYPESFSFASSDVTAGSNLSLEDYIGLTDAKMYQYKEKNKRPLATRTSSGQ